MPFTPLDQMIIDFFNQLWGGNGFGTLILITLSLLIACVLAGVIGFEREYHGHAAGLRTHLLVAIGSAMIMIVSIYGFSYVDPQGAVIVRDPARLAAQVVSGIGFLGAGTIVQTGTDVKGLTTATTLWLVMAIGLAAGSGNFIIATLGTLIAFIALVMLRKVEKFATRRNPVLIMLVKDDKPVLKDVLVIASKYGLRFRDTASRLIEYNGDQCIRLVLKTSHSSESMIAAFIDDIRKTINPLDLKLSTDG